eukprot:6460461-Amphidinium_carterae.2
MRVRLGCGLRLREEGPVSPGPWEQGIMRRVFSNGDLQRLRRLRSLSPPSAVASTSITDPTHEKRKKPRAGIYLPKAKAKPDDKTHSAVLRENILGQWLSIIDSNFTDNSLLFRMLRKAVSDAERMQTMRDTFVPKATNAFITRLISLKLFIAWRVKVNPMTEAELPPDGA